MTIHFDRPRAHVHVALITIDRPESHNALDSDHLAALAGAWDSVAGDVDIRVAVVTGAGGCFSSGADLKSFEGIVGRSPGDLLAQTRMYTAALLRGRALDKPVIAAVDGDCRGAGMELVGATDLRVAAFGATFGLPEISRGIIAAGGTLARLARQVPYAFAMELLLTGQTMGAADALRIGFVNRVVPAEQLLEVTLELADAVAANAPLAVQTTKRVVARGFELTLADAYRLEEQAASDVLHTADAAEGMAAFVQRRAPVWMGE